MPPTQLLNRRLKSPRVSPHGDEAGSRPERFYRPELDVVRFLAFFCVFLHHTIPAYPHWHPELISPIGSSLAFGLCLFFVLSAYLITSLLLREKSRVGTIRLGRFYQRRMLRIWPLYLLALAAAMLWSLHVGQFHAQRMWFAAALLMAGNIVPLPVTLASHLWSISVEEQFYLIWPGLMKWVSLRGLAIAALAMLAVSNGTLVYFGLTHAKTDPAIWMSSLVQFEMFAAGILLALWHAGGVKTLSVPMRIGGFVFVPIAWLAAGAAFHIKQADVAARGPVSLCLGYALVALSCAWLIASFLGPTGGERWPRWLIYLGQISYGLYVFHEPVLMLLFREAPIHSGTILKVLAFVITIVAAAISYRFFESPFLRWKARLEVVGTLPIETVEPGKA